MKKIYFLLFVNFLTLSVGAQISSNKLFNNLKEPTKSAGVPTVTLFGSGGLKFLIGDTTESMQPATGSIGASFIVENETEIAFGVSINSFNEKEINSSAEYGSELMAPDLSGVSGSLSIIKYFKGDASSLYGINIEGIIASSKWRLDSSIVYNSAPYSIKAAIIYAPFKSLAQRSRLNNYCNIYFAFGIIGKGVLGDIVNNSDDRSAYFGTEKTFFVGVEPGVNLIINDTRVFVQIPIIFGKTKIDGLTGGQPIIGVVTNGKLWDFPASNNIPIEKY